MSIERPLLEETPAFTACFQSGPMEQFPGLRSPCTWHICFLVVLELQPLGQHFRHPRHLWAFTPDVFAHGHRQAAGVQCVCWGSSQETQQLGC